ncbi:MAG TPA: polysaccharide deacetylase family protein [Candidatus Angelobacter sp.]|nr:polysaccharide deacetylase family protein [Candidatus Angelobacter sp.]
MSVARRIKSLGHSVSFRCGLSTVAAKRQLCGRIIMYHGVVGRDGPLLAAQLRYLRRHFPIVPLGQVVETVAAGRPLKNEIALTFDDGLLNNATVAYPILKCLGIPATFFVCPGLAGTGRWLWTHETRCRLRSLAPGTLPSLARKLSPAAATEDGIVEWMKSLRLDYRLAAEEKIRLATPYFQPSALEREACDLMDWDALRSLDSDLITIGSHTLTHPILPTLDEAAIHFEMTESRRQLEQKLNRAVNYFCYPNGSFNTQALLAARQTYSAAVTAENGILNGQDRDLHRMPRIPATRDCALLAWRLYRPGA